MNWRIFFIDCYFHSSAKPINEEIHFYFKLQDVQWNEFIDTATLSCELRRSYAFNTWRQNLVANHIVSRNKFRFIFRQQWLHGDLVTVFPFNHLPRRQFPGHISLFISESHWSSLHPLICIYFLVTADEMSSHKPTMNLMNRFLCSRCSPQRAALLLHN